MSSNSRFDVSHLDSVTATQLLTVLDRYPEVFTDKLRVTSKIQYKIQLTDQVHVRQSPYRLSPPKIKILCSLVDGMLCEGVAIPFTSPYASLVFLVPKGKSEDFRAVVDYRLANEKVVQESVPLPDLRNCFTWFSGARYF